MKKSKIRIIRLIIGAMVVLGTLSVAAYTKSGDTIDIVIKSATGSHYIKAEVASSPDEKALGLMHRVYLPDGRGMIFPYQKEVQPAFWMKNMRIPLDLIFIGGDKKIRHIEKKVPPCQPGTRCATYGPPVPVQYVLEVISGYAEAYKVSAGNDVTIEGY
jgi:hypothetical protein